MSNRFFQVTDLMFSECVESEIKMQHSEKEHHNKETDVVMLFNDNKTKHGRRKQNKCGWVLPQKNKLLEYMPFSVVWCLLINGRGRVIGRCYLHYVCPLTSQHYKRRLFKHNSSGAAGKGVVFLKRATRVRVRLLPKSFFSLFTSHITSERHLLSIKNKNEGNNRKV